MIPTSNTSEAARLSLLLEPAMRRKSQLAALLSASMALRVTAWLALLGAVLRWLWLPALGLQHVALLLLIPIFAALISYSRRRALADAARDIDRHYGLKDRTLSALDFTQRTACSDFERLQIDEALQHLTTIDAREVVPIRVPSSLKVTAVVALMSCGLLSWPLTPREAIAEARPHAGVEAAVDAIAQEIREIEELANQAKETQPELKSLAEELTEQLKVMKIPGMQPREALQSISEMQARLSEKLQEFKPQVVDAQMKNLSEALSSAEPFKPSAAEMQKGNYQQAANELEKMERPELDRKSARTAQEKLDQAAKSMDEQGLKELSESVKQLSDAIKNSDAAQLEEATKDLAQETREQGLRKEIGQKLGLKLGRLGELKSLAQSGDQEGNRNSMQKGKNQKSERSSQTFGQGDHGKLDGAKTELSTTRQFQQLTGTLGEGDSEKETSTSTEQTSESAKRKHQAVYGKYQKLSEAVLESEPIPLGQRQMIRKYFELIRPESDE